MFDPQMALVSKHLARIVGELEQDTGNSECWVKAQQAIENNDRKRMVEVLAESDVKEQGIDNSIKAAEEATAAAKENYQGMSNEEIAAELERRLKQ